MFNERLIEDIVFNNRSIEVSQEQYALVDRSYNFLAEYQKGKIIYGINTGFGPMAQYRIDDAELNDLQYNIIRSHSCGAGNPIPKESVRAALLSRLQTFLAGKSAVHRDTVDVIVAFLNNDITPIIPEHGSVGASGDLVQLSHLALALIGEGEVLYKGEVMVASQAMEICSIKPLKMYIREGLAITNGTGVMTGVALVNLSYARKLLRWSLLGSVMMNEIAASYDDFMSEVLNGLKLHEGQIEVAAMMREVAASSRLLRSREVELYGSSEESSERRVFKHKVQPYYSLRCIPQILGPILETVNNVSKVLLEEFESVDDNPIVDPESECVYHGGNFHGDYVSFEMDKLKIAITKMTMLVERQLNYLFHDRINGILPPFVNLGKLGLNYGLQAAQFTATSTTAECQMLSNPMYVHSIPNNNDNQDIVSMGTNSAMTAQRVLENSFQVMSIHMMALVQAVDCLEIKEGLSEQTRWLYDEIRAIVPPFADDTTKFQEIKDIVAYLKR
ncbi:MAG: aromatic amino acid ammonia-lyase [Rikenellaceae bacterium]